MGGGAEAVCVHIGTHMTNMLANVSTYVMSGLSTVASIKSIVSYSWHQNMQIQLGSKGLGLTSCINNIRKISPLRII